MKFSIFILIKWVLLLFSFIKLLRLISAYKYAEIVKKVIETKVKIMIKGIINFNHLSYPTFTMASEAKINPVGFIKANNPTPKRYAFTTCSLPKLGFNVVTQQNFFVI